MTTPRPNALERLHALLFRVGHRLEVPDFDARAFFPDAQQQVLLRRKLLEALRLVSAYAPVRYVHLKQHLPKILVGATPNVGECLAGVGVCLLGFDCTVADKTSAEGLAMTLVHEGTHARLLHAGLKYTETCRHRVERLCVLAELIFARRLPNALHLVHRAEARLEQPAERWSDAALQAETLKRLRGMGWYGRPAAALVHMVYRVKHSRTTRAV